MSNLITAIKEKIPGTAEHEAIIKSERMALSVMNKWHEGETVYSQLTDRIIANRDFYLGSVNEQFNNRTVEGELRIVTNVGATIMDLIVYLLSNNMPTIQVIPKDTTRVSQVEASITEDLSNKMLRGMEFHSKFKNSCWLAVSSGFVWWYPFWNSETEFGRQKNRVDLSVLNPLSTRVFYESTDYTRIPEFITIKRLTPEAIYKMYNGFEARPDRENVFLPREIDNIDDGKVTIFKQYDSKYVTTIIDNRVAEKPYEHGLDFAPIIQINNKFVVNDAHGHDDVFRMLPVCQELNMLISAASEIARDLGWPSILEYNGALGGKKLPKMRGNKIPLRRTDKGEGLEYLVNPAQMGPLLEQIRLLLDLFHFVSLMPKAAAGIFDSSVTSGFQARIAMQPATLSSESKRIDFDQGIRKLVQTGLYLIEKNDPKALQIDENTKLTGLYDLELRVVWPDNLPIDIAREIQNLVLGIQNSLTSVTQAVDKYNTMMGMGSSEETIQYLKTEAQDSKLAPERALKVAQVEQTLAQIGQAVQGVRESLNVNAMPEEFLPGGNSANAAKMTKGEDEKKVAPATAREAVTLESTGGEALPL